jgi:hypothetical protein
VQVTVPPRSIENFRRGHTNADDTCNITDAVYLLNDLFLGGPPPEPPFPTCSPEPTSDELGCEEFPLASCP